LTNREEGTFFMKDLKAIIFPRRNFIKGSAGVLAGGITMGEIISPALASAEAPAMGAWPYAPLDPVAIAQSAWNPPGCDGCGGKSFGAIVYGLRSALGPGSIWEQIPINLGSFHNGGGPMSQTCGALLSSYLLMSFVGAGRALGKQFYQWYSEFAFPSAEWDNYVPASGPAPSKNLVRTVANSTLCSMSRGTWQKEYNRLYGEGATEPRNDRCTKLVCDCTKKAVNMLNDWKAGKQPSAAMDNKQERH
jgi:hypothetical protein